MLNAFLICKIFTVLNPQKCRAISQYFSNIKYIKEQEKNSQLRVSLSCSLVELVFNT